MFKTFDKDSDGKLSYEEVKEGYNKYYGHYISESEVKELFEQMDATGNGYVEYNEFVSAAMDKRELLSE